MIMMGAEVRKSGVQQSIYTKKYQNIIGQYQWFVEFVTVDKSKGLKYVSQHGKNENHPAKINPSFPVSQKQGKRSVHITGNSFLHSGLALCLRKL